eukprot:Nitzschia sp. Nitz4//scaffold35_size145790//73919//75823//NITZ4_003029-RA/size145790-processed-gene-0.237-mRNA-1//-1//CDS//3329549121//8416//frame0
MADQSFEDKVKAEMEKASDMKISELKMKLQARGVLTATFCEKSEFIRAFAESEVRAAEKSGATVEDVNDEDEDDEDGEVEVQLPKYIQDRVKRLEDLHEEREKIMKEYLAERAKLEAKFQGLVKPLYEKRTDIIHGKLDEEIAKESTESEEDEEKESGIPQFWVLALAHMETVADMLTEHDISCLESLEDIQCEDHENGEGFTLRFHFAENDYFENKVLTKRYDVPNLLLDDEPILKNVEGCEIQWKEGKSLTFEKKEQKQRGTGKNAGQIRVVIKNEKKDSFFHFFTPPKLPSLETMDEEEAARLESAYDSDYDVAQAFRTHIVPKAVLWYSGHAMEKEMDDAMGSTWPDSLVPQEGGQTLRHWGSWGQKQTTSARLFPPPQFLVVLSPQQPTMSESKYFIEVSEKLPTLEECYSFVNDPGCGAVSTFVGTTRDNFHGKKVTKLSYEGYVPMAKKELRKLCDDACEKYEVHKIAAVHVLGDCPVGEASVILACSSPHRRAALHCCEYLIDELKARVPIWKLEVYEGDDSVWKENVEWHEGKQRRVMVKSKESS